MKDKKFENLIVKLFENKISEHESNQLFKWLEEEDNLTYFNKLVEINHFLHDAEDFDYEKSLATVHKRIRQRQYRRYRKVTLRFAAALTLLLGIGYLTLTVFQKKIEPVETQHVTSIHDNTIETGSDKAILVLGDGTQIPLSKEEHFSNENVQSGEDKVVYNDTKTDQPDLDYNYLKVPRGGQFSLKLSDGTQVWLNSESELKYPVQFKSGAVREVELLYGEAYFDVSPSTEHDGDRFRVKARNTMEAEVLGTEFNIKAYPEEKNILTTLVNGEVVLKKESEEAVLKPYQQGVLGMDETEFKVETLSSLNEVLWKEGIFSFKDKSLKEMMLVLSRWYDMDVEFENKAVEELEFSGLFTKDQSIEEIMTLISRTNTIEYDINNKTLILK